MRKRWTEGKQAVEIESAAVEIVSSNSKTVSQVLPKSLHNANKGLHNGANVQRKFQEMLMQANSQTITLFLTTRDDRIVER